MKQALIILICVFISKKEGVLNILHLFFNTPNDLSITFLAFA